MLTARKGGSRETDSVTHEQPIQFVSDIPRVHATLRPSRVAIVSGGRSTTYDELDRRSSQVANALLAAGVPPQARVAIASRNTDRFFELMFGAAKANVALVPLNWRLASPELAHAIDDCAAEVLVVGAELFDAVDGIRALLTGVKAIIALEGAHDGWEAYTSWRDRQATIDPHLNTADDDVVLQMYTSGTTGHPKGVELTNQNILSSLPTMAEAGRWTDQDVSLVCLPFCHVGGSLWGVAGFFTGSINVLTEPVPLDVLRAIVDHRITRVLMVPALIQVMLLVPGVREMDFSSLNLVAYGASPISPELLRAAMTTFGCGFGQLYGLTETGGGICYLGPEDHDLANPQRLLSCGKPFNSVDIRVVDGQARVLPANTVGQIICRSAKNMRGYWRMPEETSKTIIDGWLYTGDVGYFDADGFLYICDRLTDVVITGGENVYPAEVERVLLEHPAVAEVAVIGTPDDRWGEAVVAFVGRKPQAAVTSQELLDFARGRIAAFKIPSSVQFVERLPRNQSGKVLKEQLRQPYWEGRARRVN
jgi:acyl-CoA synthetase (AMP-forming)/AMP-acid ligase II